MLIRALREATGIDLRHLRKAVFRILCAQLFVLQVVILICKLQEIRLFAQKRGKNVIKPLINPVRTERFGFNSIKAL